MSLDLQDKEAMLLLAQPDIVRQIRMRLEQLQPRSIKARTLRLSDCLSGLASLFVTDSPGFFFVDGGTVGKSYKYRAQTTAFAAALDTMGKLRWSLDRVDARKSPCPWNRNVHKEHINARNWADAQ